MATDDRIVVTKNQIIAALNQLGVSAGDCVIVHSSLSSLGHVKGGIATVIDAFLETLGSEGTLVMPTLCQKEKDRRFETWNIKESPSDVGKITESFRLRPGSIRSDHPTHSVAAKGPLAVEITRGHKTASGRTGPWGEAAFGKGSPWEKLYDFDAKIVLVGVDFRINTMVHFIEHRIVERSLSHIPADRRQIFLDKVSGWNKPGVWSGFDRLKLQGECDKLGLISRVQCGNAMLMMVSTKALVDNAVGIMEADPCSWFNEEFCLWNDISLPKNGNTKKQAGLLMFQKIEPLDGPLAQKILESGIRVLKRVGFTIDGTDEFFDYLRTYGCKIAGTHVSFPDAVIDKALVRIAEERKRQQAGTYMPAEKITLYASGQGDLWSRPEDDQIQPATQHDLAAYSRMLDALDMPRCHPGIIPHDVPLTTAELHAFATITLNSRKPWRVSPYSAGIIPYFLEVMTVVTGSRKAAVAQGAPLFAHKLWVNSPFMIGRETIEGVMTSRRLLGHKLTVTIMPVSGATAPVTVAGAAVQEVAEVLAANIITLAVDDILAGYPSSTFAFDVKDNFPCEAGPDSDLRRIFGARIAQHWFGYQFPVIGIAPRTSAPIPGVQSIMEKGIDMTVAVMSGVREFNSAGTLSQGDAVSPVQLLLDVELRDYLQQLIRPVDISTERLAEETIVATAPHGARYLENEDTLRFFRQELWFPNLMDRRSAKAWKNNPTTMIDTARKKALDLLKNAPNQCSLDSGQRAEITRICTAADRDLSEIKQVP